MAELTHGLTCNHEISRWQAIAGRVSNDECALAVRGFVGLFERRNQRRNGVGVRVASPAAIDVLHPMKVATGHIEHLFDLFGCDDLSEAIADPGSGFEAGSSA